MRAPSSGTLPDISLQYIEASHVTPLATNYCRYTHDILLVSDSTKTNIKSILIVFNSINPNLNCTAATESNNTINYLDISIHKTEHNIQISTYTKPTFTNTIILYSSKHPTQNKYATIRYLYNGLHTYQLNNEAYNPEINFIHNIVYRISSTI